MRLANYSWEKGREEQSTQPGWPDKYRPRTLEDLALAPEVRDRLRQYLNARELPRHLILYGPPGTGKTTVANVVASALYPGERAVQRLPASSSGDVEHVRSVVQWMRDSLHSLVTPEDWRGLVILNEAGNLTGPAQDALKDALEDFAGHVRVIFTTNDLDAMSEPIRSRCEVLEMEPPPLEERARVLQRVAASEGYAVEFVDALQFAAGYEDVRVLLGEAQASFLQFGELRTPDGGEISGWDAAPEPIDGVRVLDDLCATFSRYLSLPAGSAEALALWTMFANAHEAFGYSPILVLKSPTMRSGKTRLFEVLEALTPKAVFTSNITPAAIFRLRGRVSAEENNEPTLQPPGVTLLADEGDTWVRLRPEVQGILNSGHTRHGAYVIRVEHGRAARFSTWFPKAVALIEQSAHLLPGTVTDRSVLIPMRRRRPDEPIAEWRSDQTPGELRVHKRQAARWALDNFFRLREAQPVMPDHLNDRAKDNWRPLFAVALVASGDWPDRARQACRLLTGGAGEDEELSVQLLGDIREIVGVQPDGPNWIPTRALVERLWDMEDHPWVAEVPAKSAGSRLAQLLRPFGIRPKAAWQGSGQFQKGSLRGYYVKDFQDAFARYLPQRDGGGK